MMRTLCLHPPSYEGFDGGAGSAPGSGRPAGEWDRAFAAALASIDLDLEPGSPPTVHACQEAGRR